MLVSQILKTKPAEVIHIAPDATVAGAVAMLSQRRIGALIVSADGVSCVGILSERDIVRELGKRGPAVLEDPVSALMTTKVTGCSSGDLTLTVLQQMTDGRFRHMPVFDGTRVIAVISIGDVVKARLEELAAEKDALEGMIKGF
ncbi:CBS domain-containing protein [Xinfangfangia sp. CPCC 101601]|uniref:CBS domain-containing protein n=1 Tax=Pseudogemmobacter lacusdianii TaxID=3069608 RepID=A0ABU0VV70_9RHOB|nr:CBS domain-containing protein [Xinfangfangia sp. CPCC 101601]MDQ2065543.1 CBS domain-containing protein [Xinfangfangia sp. CPCC 101601]